MQVILLESEEWTIAEQNGLTKALCKTAVAEAVTKAGKLLPTLSPYLNILIRPHAEKTVPDFAVGGETYDSELILLSFDQSLPHGKKALIKQLKATTFHEANHAARFAWIAKTNIFEKTLVEWAVWEGLATVCERDFGKTAPNYGNYHDDKTMLVWLNDLKAADKRKDEWAKWAKKRKDGRDWLAYRVGTWIVDKAMANTGKTISELTCTPAVKIIEFSGV